MVFSDLKFILIFLPMVLSVCFLLKQSYRNTFLLLASLVFYAVGEPWFVIVMAGSVVVNYAFARWISRAQQRSAGKRQRLPLVLAVVFNLALLFIFKYLNFTTGILESITDGRVGRTWLPLPIGISFFTFQAMSYVIDVYRGEARAERSLVKVGLYISFFPQLIAGPIVRYTTVAAQIDSRTVTLSDFAQGIKRFLMGLSKKVLLANTLAVVADVAFDAKAGELSVSMAWLGAVCYGLQILFDFSGYSDMAIGLGRMFGFHFLENFNYPYISHSISEFWRRWHMSLGSWFRDYVYFPMGGSRVSGRWRLVRNLFVVWLLTGLWHGANWTFIVWGLIYFAWISLEKLFGLPERLPKAARAAYRVLTLAVVLACWVIFRSDSLPAAMSYFSAMLGGGTAQTDQALLYLREYWTVLVAALVCCTPLVKGLAARCDLSVRMARIRDWAGAAVYLALFLLCLSYLAVDAYNPFIYFNF